jgi:uncharacterized protein
MNTGGPDAVARAPVDPGSRPHDPPAPADAPATVPTALRLRPPAQRVDPRAIRWWTVRSAIGGVLVLLPQLAGAAALAAVGLNGTVLLVTAAVTVVLAVVHLLVVPRVRFRVHRWEVTPEAVHTLAGWIRREWRIAPVARVQTVDTDQGPLQRLFGLSSVTVTTASSAGALRLDGLDAEVAARLALELTAAAQAVGGDAT